MLKKQTIWVNNKCKCCSYIFSSKTDHLGNISVRKKAHVKSNNICGNDIPLVIKLCCFAFKILQILKDDHLYALKQQKRNELLVREKLQMSWSLKLLIFNTWVWKSYHNEPDTATVYSNQRHSFISEYFIQKLKFNFIIFEKRQIVEKSPNQLFTSNNLAGQLAWLASFFMCFVIGNWGRHAQRWSQPYLPHLEFGWIYCQSSRRRSSLHAKQQVWLSWGTSGALPLSAIGPAKTEPVPLSLTLLWTGVRVENWWPRSSKMNPDSARRGKLEVVSSL